MTKAELKWFYGGGAGAFFPELWTRFTAPIPEPERADLIEAYHRRLFSGNLIEETRFGRIWAQWENALASIQNEGALGESPAEYARAFARLENHYFRHGGFLESDGWILRERHRIEHIPATIVQGRYDMVCPPHSAWSLANGWQKCQLRMINLAGHALSEPGISEALVHTMDTIRG
jgi:proline iminopeptidase